MNVKERLLNLIKLAYDEEQALVARLSDEERSEVGKPGQWSVKDYFAHNTAWKERLTQNITTMLRGENPPKPPGTDEIDEVNAEIFEEHKSKTWDEILSYAQKVYSELVECVNAVPDEKLVDTDTLPWQEGRPLWRIIAGNGYIHPIAHLADYYSKRGETSHAGKLWEEAADSLVPLSDSPDWLGVIKYNLACGYALSGYKVEAIIRLRESLKLNPDLTDWSKEDPDLASLRELSDYQSIYDE